MYHQVREIVSEEKIDQSKQQISRAAGCNISLSSPFRRPVPIPSQDLVVASFPSQKERRAEREEKPSDVRASPSPFPTLSCLLCLVSVVVSLPASSSYLVHGEKRRAHKAGIVVWRSEQKKTGGSFTPSCRRRGLEARRKEPWLVTRSRRVRARV